MPQVAVDYTKESRPYGIGNRSTNLTSGTSNQINKTGITSGVGQRVQTTPKTTTPTYTPTPTSSGSSSGGGGYSGGVAVVPSTTKVASLTKSKAC